MSAEHQSTKDHPSVAPLMCRIMGHPWEVPPQPTSYYASGFPIPTNYVCRRCGAVRDLTCEVAA